MPVQEDTSDLWEYMYYGPEVNFTRKEYYDYGYGIIVEKSSSITIKTDGFGLMTNPLQEHFHHSRLRC